ncbi:S-layer homology domain-containing protein [Bacillus infantis]|uniref:S-layer homology domain-containing protein n=1 Tax=Bacillus infantis TaxID=324767 RepID=UPI00101D253D|nr:S-layer homology domain-containing protein [Bacillus infantis]RYI28843.1 S-layer homology domain-containing protein [Bacillus infantis]
MAYQPKSYRKFLAGSVSAAVVASALAAPAGAAAAAASFPDVPTGHIAYEAITTLAEKGIINGYSDGSFKPSQLLNRGQAAALFTNALGLEVPENLNVFKDLKATSYYAQYAAAVEANGVFGGYADGTFGAGDNLTREQMASVLVRAFDLKDTGAAVNLNDLSKAHASHQENVKILVQNGVSIVSDNNFRPKETVTRAQFALFLYRAMVLTGEINENPNVVSVKAINSTTVEVKMADEVKDVEASDFTIDGLTVSNAAVKQTDNTTVVLTTSAQEGKEYTLEIKGETAGKFTGVSAVIPTAVKMSTPSVQGTIGKEVTLKAEVTVADGQSKAGIPVTFNIVNDNSNLNSKIEVEALTDENGVATYSYTRYYKNNDNVTAYATNKSSVYASGKVYWAEVLTLTEVTEGNTLANGAKKVYKVSAPEYAGAYVNVAFQENVNVAPDKLVRDVTVTDVAVGSGTYPYQVTTGGKQEVRVLLNSKGEATFTVTGSNASVTPIVFIDGSYNGSTWVYGNGKLESTELQSKASTVKFELNHTLGLSIKAEGVQNAAAINAAGIGDGGRKYTVTVTDKDGKLAPAGTKAYVTFAEGSYSNNVYLVDSDGNNTAAVNKNTRFEITVGKEGKATFTLRGLRDGFAAPTVYLDNGSTVGSLDKTDLQVVGETTYFVNAAVTNALLTVTDGSEEVTSLSAGSPAYFEYHSVDQNGFDYYVNGGAYEVSYQVTANFADVTVYGTFGSKLVKKGTTETVKVQATGGKATLRVDSDENVASNVTVQASASQVSLPNQTASISFTKDDGIPSKYTGNVVSATDEKVVFSGFEVEYDSNDTFYYLRNSTPVTLEFFQSKISKGDLVAFVKGEDGKHTFEILEDAAGATLIQNLAFTDTDGTRDEVAGDITFTGAAGHTYKVFLGDTQVSESGDTSDLAKTYTVAANTQFEDTVTVEITNTATGATAVVTLDVEDNDSWTDAAEAIQAAVDKINAAARAQVWDGVEVSDFEKVGVPAGAITSSNFADVKLSVQEARALKGTALTADEIKTAVSDITTP